MKKFIAVFITTILSLTLQNIYAQKRAMTLLDVMQFNSLNNQAISHDGNWVIADAWPDRGDGYAIVKNVRGRTSYSVERGRSPIISNDGNWVAMSLIPAFIDLERAPRPADRPRNGMILLNTRNGNKTNRENVSSYDFSNDSRWLIVHFQSPVIPDSLRSSQQRTSRSIGTQLELIDLAQNTTYTHRFVSDFSIDSTSRHLVMVYTDSTGAGNALKYIDLHQDADKTLTLMSDSGSVYTSLTWFQGNDKLAFIRAEAAKDGKHVNGSLMIFDAKSNEVTPLISNDELDGVYLPTRNPLQFSSDGNRLFFGLRDVDTSEEPGNKEPEVEFDPFDFDSILKRVELDVWHGNDPLIKTNEKVVWRQLQNQSYRSVYHFDNNGWVQLADATLRNVSVPDNSSTAIGSDNRPYLREITWDGSYSDYYAVDMSDGSRKHLLSRQRFAPQLSPDGKAIVYFTENHWHVMDIVTGVSRNLTENLDVPFFNEDHDQPSDPNGYGIAGWDVDNGRVIVYDKFDIWSFDLQNGDAVNLTLDGRTRNIQYRIQYPLLRDRIFDIGTQMILTGYYDLQKNYGFYGFEYGKQGTVRLLEERKRFRFIAKAENADVILYSREDYNEFPDLWVAPTDFRRPVKVTDLNKQLEPFAWGTSELVEWTSIDGTPVQGVLIKPGNYEPGKRYPVIVYFYELFSQRLHDFNPQVVNHRPSFPFYASNGYAIFLPDVRYTEGLPGYSATKYIVPGVQKIINMGIADPKAIGLHGHSWSGYQAAHMITQTDIFAAVVSGAPVSNMTSAYSGIRWGTGLARQFQYEKTQSRLGKTLWERPDLYIENSPVFYADRINTPILIQFGDEDEAVPWYQGIELYLALRRLDKDVIFLQYHGEPHHLQKFPNKLDYSIKMKEYFDHYLKGYPAPDWIRYGVPYRGN